MKKQLNNDDGIDFSQYLDLDGATIYSIERPASTEFKKDDIEADEVYIPEDVLSGKREWNLYWDKKDPRNAEGIMVMKER